MDYPCILRRFGPFNNKPYIRGLYLRTLIPFKKYKDKIRADGKNGDKQ